ncbi:hypothetical protein DL96DRAFT_1767832 [Flagelloscypha sp. PMI_526]|nr:hypothetical protein DL96DRAFT_1767832 [Flagelloscypha sp. PMI_526]
MTNYFCAPRDSHFTEVLQVQLRDALLLFAVTKVDYQGRLSPVIRAGGFEEDRLGITLSRNAVTSSTNAFQEKTYTRFRYTTNDWRESTDLPGFPSFSNSTPAHWTTSNKAAVELTFAVYWIRLLGVTGPSLSQHTIHLDGSATATYNAQMPQSTWNQPILDGQVLCALSGLAQDKIPSISLVALPSSPNQTFALDYVIVDGIADSNSTYANMLPLGTI